MDGYNENEQNDNDENNIEEMNISCIWIWRYWIWYPDKNIKEHHFEYQWISIAILSPHSLQTRWKDIK